MGRHVSQVYEWLPFINRNMSSVDIPHDPAGRRTTCGPSGKGVCAVTPTASEAN